VLDPSEGSIVENKKMSVQIKPYDVSTDYDRIGKFLLDTYTPGDFFLNWPQPRWEYMHYHSLVQDVDLSKIRIAEDDGKVIGLIHFEHVENQVFFQLDPEYSQLSAVFLDYAEANLRGKSAKDGRENLVAFIHEHHRSLISLVRERGYKPFPDHAEEHSNMVLDQTIPDAPLPEGFFIQSLEEENDFRKINQVLWRGFNHEGPAPEEHIQSRKDMQQAPNFRRDLNIVVVAPEGHFVSYSGIWYVDAKKVAYVEPVATDPEYRRMGLGKAAVLECIRRVKKLGAEVAWVGSGQEFYTAIGFKKRFEVVPWVKYFEEISR
jgi:predicted N-acetyltransferase YhbS